MIKQLNELSQKNIDDLAAIWLNQNLLAHNFIDSQYWLDNLPMFKDEISNAEVAVCETNDQIVGFIGLEGNYVAGLFVDSPAQHHGVGKQLLTFVKNTHPSLQLDVYEKNQRAIEFYLCQNFQRIGSDIDQDTAEKEVRMLWQKQ